MRRVSLNSRRCAAVLALVALLLVPVTALPDDGQLQPPIGAHAVAHHQELGFWDLLLICIEARI